jgi:ATP-dependent Lhr-like helicase
VSELRRELDQALAAAPVKAVAEEFARESELTQAAAEQLVDYLASARAALGSLPTRQNIIFERFFDEAGDTHLVIHSPLGARLNRAWGLALRKRFCRRFNFELQAAALEDSIVLSLGTVHSFPLDEVARYLTSSTVREVVTQALLTAPVFPGHWRWAATIALAVRRFRNGKKAPPQFQRMDAEDLLATVFPDQLACAENLTGEREIPDHPLVTQTLADCLQGVMDVNGLEKLLADIETGEVQIVCRELTSPSPLAQEVLAAKPYAFLDDAPAEERRTLAVQSRRYMSVEQAADLGRLDSTAIERVRAEAWPEPRDADELHDGLVVLGFVTAAEGAHGHDSDRGGWQQWFEQLMADGRATTYRLPQGSVLWVSAERLPELRLVAPLGEQGAPLTALPTAVADAEAALVALTRSRLEGLGPAAAHALAVPLELTAAALEQALTHLEAEGFAMRGNYTGGAVAGDAASLVEEWCERRLLARIHRYTLKRLRSEIEPVTVADYQRFLFKWQGLGVERRQGSEALAAILSELQGLALSAVAWEREILPARLVNYGADLMDQLTSAGSIVWLRPRTVTGSSSQRTRTVASSPIAIVPRQALNYWRTLAGPFGEQEVTLSAAAVRVREALSEQGALFFLELVQLTGLLRVQVEEALGELVAWGLVTADSFNGLRALVTPSSRRRGFRGRARRRGPSFDAAGRWALLDIVPLDQSAEARVEAVEHAGHSLLRRYGIVCRAVLARESNAPSWRELLTVFRRWEARGEIRGGRFVDALGGEQFALLEAVTSLRRARRDNGRGDWVVLSAADPLNLAGVLTPGGRVPAVHSHRVAYLDGVPVATLAASRVEWLADVDPTRRSQAQALLTAPVSRSGRAASNGRRAPFNRLRPVR